MKVELNNLKTVKNYAMSNHVTAAYIYKLVAEKKMKAVMVDGVQFIDVTTYPTLPTR